MQVAIESVVGERVVPASWTAAKRCIDVVLGSFLLLLSLPLITLAAIAIVLLEGGSPFYAQERVGRHGRRFKLYKLRTMVDGAHEMREHVQHLNECDGPVFKISDDPRCHPLGKILRRSSIDELPNFVNVIRGEMSLVGPRPALPSEVERYDAFAYRRLSIPQGVTGLWQINGRSDVSFAHWMEMDNRYVDEWTPLGDLAIILKTIPAVVRKNGAR
jgi:lipopolysaccharide/colanic/teichoic acid biosynthesis glycosyltransferase